MVSYIDTDMTQVAIIVHVIFNGEIYNCVHTSFQPRFDSGLLISHLSLTHKILGDLFQILFLFFNVLYQKNFYETGVQCIFGQHCGYWWSGALVAGHQ